MDYLGSIKKIFTQFSLISGVGLYGMYMDIYTQEIYFFFYDFVVIISVEAPLNGQYNAKVGRLYISLFDSGESIETLRKVHHYIYDTEVYSDKEYSFKFFQLFIQKNEQRVFYLFLSVIQEEGKKNRLSGFSRKILFAGSYGLAGPGVECNIEKAIVSLCSYSHVSLTFLYATDDTFSAGFILKLQQNYKNITFVRVAVLDDETIESYSSYTTENIFLGYDYRGKYKENTLLILHNYLIHNGKKVESLEGVYKNKYSFFESCIDETLTLLGNVQDLMIARSFVLFKKKNTKVLLFAGGYSTRDFSILNSLFSDSKYSGIIISDKKCYTKTFLSTSKLSKYMFDYIFNSIDVCVSFYRKDHYISSSTRVFHTALGYGKPNIFPRQRNTFILDVEKSNLGLLYNHNQKGDKEYINNLIDKVFRDLENYKLHCEDYSSVHIDNNICIHNILQATGF